METQATAATPQGAAISEVATLAAAAAELRTSGAAANGGRRPALLFASTAAIELVVGLLFVAAELEFWLLALHIAIVVGLVWLARRQLAGGADATAITVGVTMTAALGPLGAGAAALSMAMPIRREAPERLTEWYERIALATPNDPITRLAERVAVGRTMNLEAPAPGSFAHLMRKGSLVERQAALGLIARKFHPDYLPALRVALRSPEPVVRVQAAAVAARIQPELKKWLAELGKGSDTRLTEETDELLREMRAILASGLVDGTAAGAGRATLASLATEALAAAPGRARTTLPNTMGRIRALEDMLISSGRLADLRQLRERYRAIGPRACRVRRRGEVRTEARPSRARRSEAQGTTTGAAGARR